MTDAERLRLFRITSCGKLFGCTCSTPQAGVIAAHHERGLARLSWPLPASDAEEAALLAILRTPVPVPPPEAEAQRQRLQRIARQREQRLVGFLHAERPTPGLPPGTSP